ncbi:MAG TPA: histidine kinase, partial [Solirubrobacterales bacterium]|nr:histidine kinase [Solirubrobacterales bacterium]
GSLRPAIALIGALGAVAAGVEVALLIESGFEPAWFLPAFPLTGAVYLAAGLLAWQRRPSNRIGLLIVAAGFIWLGAGLADTAVPALTATGLILATVPLAIVVHLLLAFPSGRLRGETSTIAVAGGYLVCTLLQAPVYLFNQGPSGPTTVLQIADRHDLGVIGFWVQTLAGTAVVVATAVILLSRLRRAEQGRRRVLAPLYLYGIFALLFVPVSANVVRNWFPEEALTLAVAQLAVLAVVPLAFVAAVLRGGFARTGELEELGAWLAAEEGRPPLQAALREALGDPSLGLLFWVADPPGYVDGDGATVVPALEDPERTLVEVANGGQRVGAIVYDATVVADRQLVVDAARVIALALDHDRLTAELLASREGLRESRARLVAATDSERRRIARDLHDGLQTRLVLLALLAGRAREDETLIAELGSGLQQAIAELRELVQGVVPAALTERGLYAAAEELSDRMPIPVVLDFDSPREPLPSGVETAGYFVVSEALSNTVKHARAEELRLSIGRRNGHLRIEIADDGVGGARAGGGGLSGLADRLDAFEGRLFVDSPPGRGTRIVAELPCG